MLKEFKEFAFKGNVVDMAVGIIIGGAFGTVVKSLVDNLMMPPLGVLIANVDFKRLKIVLQPAVTGETGEVVKPEVALNYGQFATDFLSFLLLALAVFIVVKKLLAAMKKEEAPVGPATPPAEERLLTEIRDLLKERG